MTRIVLYEHPFAPAAPQRFERASLAQWLLDHYGDAPSVRVQIFKGEPSAETEISADAEAILAGDAGEYTVLQSPAGVDPVTLMYAMYAIMAVAAVAAYLLMPKPVLPGSVGNRPQASPNNQLGNRENKVRLLERVEDIYGTVKSIPSLLMPTYNKYILSLKYEYGYYCVGRGYYDIAEVRDGDTLIADITGAAASVYDPFTSPNSGDTPVLQIGDAIIDPVLNVARSISVDGVTLKAPNQSNLYAGAQPYTFTSDKTITQSALNPNFSSAAGVGDTLTIAMSPTAIDSIAGSITATIAAKSFADDASAGLFDAVLPGDSVTITGMPTTDGVWTVATKPTDDLIVVTGTPAANETGAAATCTVTRDFSGAYTLAAVSDGAATVTAATWPPRVTVACAASLNKPEFTDWITLPEPDRTEIWCNVVAPNGIYKSKGGVFATSVGFEMEIEQLDADLAPLGVVETVTGSLSGASADQSADTIEHATAWVGPARIRMRRTTNFDYQIAADGGAAVDEIKWADLYSVTPVDKAEFGNKTTIHTITQATARATAVKTRQLNCIASRLLPTYNGSAFSGAFDSTGLLVSGTLSATSKLVDIIAAVSVDPKIGARDLATEVDMAQIWAVQGLLDAWNAECGQFNYTFDSDSISFEETVVTIANAGFCIAYRQNGKIRLAFDRVQAASTALFTHRNKKPRAETITRKFASDAEYDGVEFVYVDPDSNQSETITLPLDASYTKLKKFEIAGIRNFTQAWLRANREYQKLIGQRITIETATTLDARTLLPNSRVDIVDNTRFQSYDGEVVGQSGLTLTLSQDVAFIPATAHSIVLMKRDGSLQSLAATAGPSANQVVLAGAPAEAIVTTGGADGIRTIYSFAADSARGAMAYIVQELDITDGQYVTLRAINYSDSYYTADHASIPAKDTIIN